MDQGKKRGTAEEGMSIYEDNKFQRIKRGFLSFLPRVPNISDSIINKELGLGGSFCFLSFDSVPGCQPAPKQMESLLYILLD